MHTPLVRYNLAVSLDGFIGPKDGSVDWLEPYGAAAEEIMTPFMEEIGGLIMGRLTYEKCQSLGGWPLGHMPTAVLSSSTSLELNQAFEVCHGGPKEAIANLAQHMNKGDIWLVGGGQTATWFLEEGLLNRVELTTIPVVLGSGISLFPKLKTLQTFDLLSSKPAALGTIFTEYARPSK